MQQNNQNNQQNKPQGQQNVPAQGQQSVPVQGEPKKVLSWEPAKGGVPHAATSAASTATRTVTGAQSPTKRASAIIAAVVILVALAAWGVSALREHSTSAGKTVAGKEDSAVAAGASGTNGESSLLSVPPQKAGTSVHVEGLSVTEPTWVVVYDNVASKPGNTLGAALAFPGQNAVDVSLMRKTVSGTSYLVGESASDNGSHTYSRGLPQLEVWATFTAQ